MKSFEEVQLERDLISNNRKLKIIDLEIKIKQKNQKIATLTRAANHFHSEYKKYRLKYVKTVEQGKDYYMLEEKRQNKEIKTGLYCTVCFFVGISVTTVFL